MPGPAGPLSVPTTATRQTPLPLIPVLILMVVRLAEPIQYTVCFPFINEMVEELHVTDNPDRIGYYSGVIESVFALVQFFTVYHWAKLSDRCGRKPVIIFGLIGVAISGSLFGFSKKFWQMVITRCMSGALNGNVAVVRAALADIVDDSNSTEAFALYGLVWTVGSVFGNTIGGYLSHPVERIPSLFAGFNLLEQYPFLLPCLVTTSITLAGLLFTLFFFRETHVVTKSGAPLPSPGAASSLYDDEDEDARTLVGDIDSPKFASDPQWSRKSQQSQQPVFAREWTAWEIMSVRAVARVLISLFLLSFVGGAWGAVSLLFFYTPTASGGLGLSPSIIGTAMALQGLWSIVCQLGFLNRIRRRFGMALSYQMLNTSYILVFLSLPLLRTVVIMAEGNHAGELGSPTEEHRSIWVWLALLLWLALSTVAGMANSLSMVLVNTNAPDRNALGALNGLSTAVGCLARVLGPSIVSAIFAVSIDKQILGGHAWWIFMTVVSTISAVVGMLVTEKPSATELHEAEEAGLMSELDEPDAHELK